MTPADIKREAANCKCKCCSTIIDQDMFIGYKASIEPKWKGNLTRTLDYDARCNGCGEWMKSGIEAIWIKNVGAWHIEHYKNPR